MALPCVAAGVPARRGLGGHPEPAGRDARRYAMIRRGLAARTP